MAARAGDPAHDVLGHEQRALDAIFAPRTVALIGATDTPGSVGRAIFENLTGGTFKGRVFAVNPHRGTLLGHATYPTIAAVPERVDLAVVATPAATVPGVIRECVDAGVCGAIVISAGFKERGPEGAERERQVLAEARRERPGGPLRLLGPNCLGIMRPHIGLNTTFAALGAQPGNVAFVSQSGALCTAILDWSVRERVGFSAFVSTGSMLDVDWGDLIDYLGDDPRTQSILLYMETIGDARSFMSAAREVALNKPIIVIKAGRTPAAAQAAASHTGSLTGSDDVVDAAFRQCGVLRVDTLASLFYMAEVMSRQPRPRGPRLVILTNAGGPGVLAADALVGRGGALASLDQGTIDDLDRFLPEHWSHGNPIDILGDAGADRYGQALALAAKDPNTDGVLVIFAPQAIADPVEVASALRPFAQIRGKPILASWMGGPSVAAAVSVLNEANIPTFSYPDAAARAFYEMWRYDRTLRGLYENPVLPAGSDREVADRAVVSELLDGIRATGRTILSEAESKRLLAAYDIPVVETRIAATVEEAMAAADALGYPVVLKLHSETITHKTDVGGVHLRLPGADAVRGAFRAIEAAVRERASAADFLGVTVQPMIAADGYELILGSSIDPQFGPVLLVGAGGQLVEVLADRAVALPPLNTTLARRVLERTRIFAALEGVRGRRPVDSQALAELMVRFSQLVVEQRWIKELDINPLLASPDGLLALDARVVLYGPDVTAAELPRLAILPYPTQYAAPWTMRSGEQITIRPIRPEDEPAMVRFHERLSEQTVYTRYFHALKLDQRIAHERLVRVCFIDYDREMALVAVREHPALGEHQILGVGRLSRLHGVNQSEFAVLISDQYQGQGLGTELLWRLVAIGREQRLNRIVADILPENRGMQLVSKKAGFRLRHDFHEGVVKAELDLT